MSSIYLKYKLNFYQNLYRNNSNKEDSLTVMEKFCAEAIFALQGPTVNELAKFIRVSQPNAAYKVNNLVKKGHVEKVRSQKDRRQIHLFVTEKFKTYYQVNYEFLEEILKMLREKVSDEDLEVFKKVLEVMDDGVLESVSKYLDADYHNPYLEG
ncbi:MAG: MarR family winged helix-turn-helix transcriptional regulator [Peptoniphilus sp.]|nr:MarR family winged helix-turn-helix transcriptional regulator [Peptoniphilus sp.]MDD7363528.1 MarR family winged helix-turn-helix transcriptional regulator [Bacillota bacterium]MDY6044769.1 MarR family winged helix-turn-helix transcriptional regulator [Peptoniphilus sp.]